MTIALTTGSASMRKLATTSGSSSSSTQVMNRPSGPGSPGFSERSFRAVSRGEFHERVNRAWCCRDPGEDGGSSARIRMFGSVGKVGPRAGAQGSGLRFTATLKGQRAESRNEGRSFEVSRYLRVGQIEAYAVPCSILVYGGFQESEAPSNALSARSCQSLGRHCSRLDNLPSRCRGASGRRGVMHVLLRNSSDAAPVFAALRSCALNLLLGGSTTCVDVSLSSCT